VSVIQALQSSDSMNYFQRAAFFAVRIFLALITVLCEAKFYRTVHEKVNDRVGRYLFFMLLFSAGMWNASTSISHVSSSSVYT
jgi:alpha-1,2-mannosyltransferase